MRASYPAVTHARHSPQVAQPRYQGLPHEDYQETFLFADRIRR